MVRVRRNWMWGVVFGWAAARCCVPVMADEPPSPPGSQPIPSAVATPSPPSSVGVPSTVPTPVTAPIPFGSSVPVTTQSAPQPAPLPEPVNIKRVGNLPPNGTTGVPNGVPGGVPNAPQNLGNGNSVALEVVTERYPNKQVAIERNVARDQKNNYVNHGTWTMWDPEGRELCKGDFYQGKATGKWTRTFYEGGNDHYTGPEYMDFTRPFRAEATYAEDKLVGIWTLADNQGRLIHSWEFSEDRLNGKALAFYPSGKVRRELTYRDAVLSGDAIEFDAEGNRVSATTWQAGRKLGPTVQKYPNGAKYSEGEYYYAREEKNFTYDFFKGEISADRLAKKGADARHGHWTWWYEDGEKMCEGDFIDGKATGHHVWYHPNGGRQMEGDFDAGKRTGTWISWHVNGQKKSEGAYEAGKEVGQWFEWKDDGKVASQRNHGQFRGLLPGTQPQPQQRPAVAGQPNNGTTQQMSGQQIPGRLDNGLIPGIPADQQPFAGKLAPGQYVQQVGPNEYVIQGGDAGQLPPNAFQNGQQFQSTKSSDGRRFKPLVEYLPSKTRR